MTAKRRNKKPSGCMAVSKAFCNGKLSPQARTMAKPTAKLWRDAEAL